MKDFFEEVYELAKEHDLQMTISRKGQNMILSFLPVARTKKKKEETDKLIPLVVSGAPSVVRDHFFEAVVDPAKFVFTELQSNSDAYKKRAPKGKADDKGATGTTGPTKSSPGKTEKNKKASEPVGETLFSQPPEKETSKKEEPKSKPEPKPEPKVVAADQQTSNTEVDEDDEF